MKRSFILRWCQLSALVALVAGGPRLGFAAQPRASASTNALTLDEALRLALANNPELRASGGRVEAAAGRADQARRWTNPELELASEDVPVRSGSFRDSKNTIGVAQTVPWPGKKKLDGQIGTAGVRLSEADLSLRRVELVRDVKTAFYRVLAAERLVAVAGELVQFAESSASTARKRVEAGAAADQEQLRAEIQLDQARTELAAFQRELVSARQELVTLLGRPDLSDAPVSGALVETPDTARLGHGPAQWLANHPSVVAARSVRDRTELELRRARLEPYPDVRLGVDGGREGREDNAIVQFRVSLPLPIVDRSKGRKREAQANMGVAEAELVATEQRLLREWGTVSQRFRTAAEQVAAYRERILPRASKALHLVQTGFEEGKFGFIDLLDTQRTTAEARLAYQQKLLELNTAQAELEALLGATPVPGQPPISTEPK
ncbi:MAG: TolC family protein [Verrucomicrobia bacterium]|nr:TolC family protein [Verrucomicrobiota bacterium]